MRKYLGIIAIAFIFIFSFGTFFGLARGTLNNIAGFDFQTVNEENFIKVDDYVIAATEEDAEADIKISIDEDGIITLDGKNKTEEAVEMQVVTVSLEKGSYEFVSNAKGCSEDTYQVIMKDSEGGKIVANEEFTLEETTTFNVYIVVYANAEVDTEFAPVIVTEGEKTSFLVNNWNIFKK